MRRYYFLEKTSEKAPAKTEAEKTVAQKAPPPQAEAKTAAPKSSLRVTTDTVGSFTKAYDERREISSEMKSLDERAQKGKIPRRQYKVQRRSLEVRFDSLTRNINEAKEVFRNSGSGYADLIKQLDSAEKDWTEAEENIKNLDAKQNSGEISIEEYKKNIGGYKRRKEKADSSISGILLRLREKMR
jgi:chromosome segregation ATPase